MHPDMLFPAFESDFCSSLTILPECSPDEDPWSDTSDVSTERRYTRKIAKAAPLI